MQEAKDENSKLKKKLEKEGHIKNNEISKKGKIDGHELIIRGVIDRRRQNTASGPCVFCLAMLET